MTARKTLAAKRCWLLSVLLLEGLLPEGGCDRGWLTLHPAPEENIPVVLPVKAHVSDEPVFTIVAAHALQRPGPDLAVLLDPPEGVAEQPALVALAEVLEPEQGGGLKVDALLAAGYGYALRGRCVHVPEEAGGEAPRHVDRPIMNVPVQRR